MNASIRTHRSVAYIKPIDKRWKGYGRVDSINESVQIYCSHGLRLP